MTLFHHAAPEDAVFAQMLARFYDGAVDEMTEARLGSGAG